MTATMIPLPVPLNLFLNGGAPTVLPLVLISGSKRRGRSTRSIESSATTSARLRGSDHERTVLFNQQTCVIAGRPRTGATASAPGKRARELLSIVSVIGPATLKKLSRSETTLT